MTQVTRLRKEYVYEILFISKLKALITSLSFQVLTAASMKMVVFWDIAPCCLAEYY
jgi:hypothetical protein